MATNIVAPADEVAPPRAGLHAAIGGEEQHGHLHEKKPAVVLKKVKEKVKKIKNTISKKALHGHNRDRNHGSLEELDYEEEEDDEEEIYREEEEDDDDKPAVGHDPEVHGAGQGTEEHVAGAAMSGEPPARGGGEVGVALVARSFEDMAVADKPPANDGTHEQQQQPRRSYMETLKSAAAAVYSKVAGVGTKQGIAEKLKPGEEDKALAEVISEAVQRQRETEGASVPQEARGGGGVLLVEKMRGATASLVGGGAATAAGESQQKGEDGGDHAAVAAGPRRLEDVLRVPENDKQGGREAETRVV